MRWSCREVSTDSEQGLAQANPGRAGGRRAGGWLCPDGAGGAHQAPSPSAWGGGSCPVRGREDGDACLCQLPCRGGQGAPHSSPPAPAAPQPRGCSGSRAGAGFAPWLRGTELSSEEQGKQGSAWRELDTGTPAVLSAGRGSPAGLSTTHGRALPSKDVALIHGQAGASGAGGSCQGSCIPSAARSRRAVGTGGG